METRQSELHLYMNRFLNNSNFYVPYFPTLVLSNNILPPDNLQVCTWTIPISCEIKILQLTKLQKINLILCIGHFGVNKIQFYLVLGAIRAPKAQILVSNNILQ